MGVMEHRTIGGRPLVGMTFVLVALLFAACSSSASAPGLDTVGSGVRGAAEGGVPPATAAPAASMAPAPAGEPAGGDAFSGSGQQGYVPAIPRDDLKIVYTGSLQLVVDDLQAKLAQAQAAIEATGGYIGASQESNDGDKPVATITYRIPATRWEDAISSLRHLATKVVAEQTQASEVGGQLVDLDARIRNLQASEASLQEIAKGTGKVSDLLEVEAQLTDVRGQIEQLQGQQAQLTDQVAYGTLVTTFGLEIQQVQETAKGWDPAAEVDAATASLIGTGQTIASAAIWFAIVWLPMILVLAILVLISFRVLRRIMPPVRPVAPVDGWGGS